MPPQNTKTDSFSESVVCRFCMRVWDLLKIFRLSYEFVWMSLGRHGMPKVEQLVCNLPEGTCHSYVFFISLGKNRLENCDSLNNYKLFGKWVSLATGFFPVFFFIFLTKWYNIKKHYFRLSFLKRKNSFVTKNHQQQKKLCMHKTQEHSSCWCVINFKCQYFFSI